jgi:N-acetylglucosaminyldiphosphoundecaprenol N-acetyl-beta-D-mannosaminyltransferase
MTLAGSAVESMSSQMPERVEIVGSEVTSCDSEHALDLMESQLRGGGGGYVCFTNVHAVVMGRRDRAFRSITNGSFLSVADGKPVFWVGRMKGAESLGHVPGPDFFFQALARYPTHRHFFYGSTPQVLQRLETALKEAIPQLQVCGKLSPAFRPLTEEDKHQHYALIRDSRADFVWVGLGAPKQEQWMAEAWQHLKPSILLGVGAAFDFYAGTVRRAPTAMGWLGLEWLYRLIQEPRRLWRRYLITNSLFVGYLLKDLVSGPPNLDQPK